MSEIDGTGGLDQRLADAIERLGHGLRSLSQRSARAQGLTPLQQQTLLALARQPEARREVKALAAEFDVTSPTMSDGVAALERKGLVVRNPGEDGRRRTLELTPAGRAAADELSGWSEPLLAALRELPGDDKAAMLHGLLAVIADLQRRGVVTVARVCTTCRFFEHHGRTGMFCGLLELPLRRRELRTDCPEHQLAEA